MKTKVILTTLIAFLLLVAVTAAGLNAVFTVTLVRADFHVYTATGRAESVALQEKLDEYVGKSTTFLDLSDLEETVLEYNAASGACFRVDRIEKKYPSVVEISIAERRESYSFLRPDGSYAIFDEDGVYLYNRAGDTNRDENRSNIRLEGFDLSLAAGKRATGKYFDEMLSVFKVFRELLSEVSANVLSVRIETMSHDPMTDCFVIQMREGVRIRIYNPSMKAAEKARAALEEERDGYLNLTDEERVYNEITVIETSNGINVDYLRT